MPYRDPQLERGRQVLKWLRLRIEVLTAYGKRCVCCGEKEPAFLTLEHTKGDGKAHRGKSGSYTAYVDLKRRGWPKDGYTLLCMNCNWAKRFGESKCPHKQSISEKRIYEKDGALFLSESATRYLRLTGSRTWRGGRHQKNFINGFINGQR